MRRFFFGLLLAGLSVFSWANGSASVSCDRGRPVLKLEYQPGTDVGVPGLFWLGVLTQDKSAGAVLTENGWVVYQDGLYPFQSRYENGFPGLISLSVAFPGDGATTMDYLGFQVYAGHGAYTPAAKSRVLTRRNTLNSVRAARIARGTWNPDYDKDDRYIWSLIQKDLVDNQKYGALITVPYVDCTPDSGY